MGNQRVVVITGASSGLGKYLAQKYFALGDRVIGIDLQFASGEHDYLTDTIEADICDSDKLSNALVQLSISQIDVLINCAGILISQPFRDFSSADFTKCITINLIGSEKIVRTTLPYLTRGSHINLIASIAGMTGVYGYAAYSASKYGVIGMARALKLELDHDAIDISIICPPSIDTPMVQTEAKTIHPATKALKDIAGTLSTEEAGDEIFSAIQARKYLIIPGFKAKCVYWLQKLTPLLDN